MWFSSIEFPAGFNVQSPTVHLRGPDLGDSPCRTASIVLLHPQESDRLLNSTSLTVPPESPHFQEIWPRRRSAGDEVIMIIAGHVMLSRYSHVRIEAKRRALDEIAARQRAADEKRRPEIQGQQAGVVVSESVVLQ